jgi:hypothetical protein
VAHVPFTFIINVQPDYWVDPEGVLEFGELRSDDSVTSTITVYNDRAKGLRVDRVVARPREALQADVSYDDALDASLVSVELDPTHIPEQRRWTGEIVLHFAGPTAYDQRTVYVRALKRAKERHGGTFGEGVGQKKSYTASVKPAPRK